MKILITYADIGAGHFKAAQALYDNLNKDSGVLDVRLIGILDKSNFLYRSCCKASYAFMVKFAPFAWRLMFSATSQKSLRKFIGISISLINRLNTKDFTRFLESENFDCIVSTHFFCSEAASRLKLEGKINSKIITIITDFGVHPLWIYRGTDIYIAAADTAKSSLIRQGVEEKSIKILGIPISQEFLRQFDKNALFRKFSLDRDKFTVLIVTGSFGIGPIEEVVSLLYEEVQILVVCARNRRLYHRLKLKNYPQVYVFGFVNNMHELMAVSSIIITKPGGLTISESLAMGLFPVFFSAIPGQETENIRILSEYGIGLYAKEASRIKEIILDFKIHPEKFKAAKENIDKIKKTYAASEIRNLICQDSIGHTC